MDPEKRDRAVLIFAGLAVVASLVLGAACPKPTPPVVNPPDADAAQHANCATACGNFAKACSTAPAPAVCLALCGSIVTDVPGYADCLAIANDCASGTACDNAVAAARKPVNGR